MLKGLVAFVLIVLSIAEGICLGSNTLNNAGGKYVQPCLNFLS